MDGVPINYTSVRSAFGNLLHDTSELPYSKDDYSIIAINLDREYKVRYGRLHEAFEIEGTRVCDVALGFINKAPDMSTLIAMLAMLED